jgi:hypothetical protein
MTGLSQDEILVRGTHLAPAPVARKTISMRQDLIEAGTPCLQVHFGCGCERIHTYFMSRTSLLRETEPNGNRPLDSSRHQTGWRIKA